MKAQKLDMVTTLPQSIIETILCYLPIEEAARTSILSREWRFKWTTIPKLVFSLSTVKLSTRECYSCDQRDKEMRFKLFIAIYQILLQRRGPIHEFTLSMESDETYPELDPIMLYLSKNHTISKLKLELGGISLPMSLFSMHQQLTDLSLKNCDITHKLVFNGFGSLTSLSLEEVYISMESLLHLLSLCLSLKSFSLYVNGHFVCPAIYPTIMEFFKCLPMVEHLTTCRDFIEYGLHVLVPEELTTSLIHLKYFCFKDMDVAESSGWTFLSVLIQCSPNLEKIKLEMDIEVVDFDVKSVKFEECSDVWLEHLNELEVENYRNLKPELEFLKFILARSPGLKRVILVTWMDDKDEELEMLRGLLSVTRASPVKIIVKKHCRAQH